MFLAVLTAIAFALISVNIVYKFLEPDQKNYLLVLIAVLALLTRKFKD